MLNGARNRYRDIKRWSDGLSRLSDLFRMGTPSRIDDGTGSADSSADNGCKFLDHGKILRTLYAAAAGNDNIRFGHI